MIDESILQVFKDAIRKSRADQTELVSESEEFYLTRFAENLIHQNMGRSDSTIWCRSVTGRKIGVARSNDASPEGVSRIAAVAADTAARQRDDDKFVSLVKSTGKPDSSGFYMNTFDFPAVRRAGAIEDIVARAGANDLSCAGTYQTSATSLAVVNSLGTERFARNTEFRFTITATAASGRSGWAQAAGRDVNRFDYRSVSQRALDKAAIAGEPLNLESGQYTVILEPDAVANLLLFLAFLGFGGKTLFQKRSFMSGKIGENIMGANITITEDPFNPSIQYLPFDYEGISKKGVVMVENGIAKAGVYDSYYAHLGDTESTGNALPPDNSYGPYPKAMVLSAGDSDVTDMIASVSRGVYITRFWYLNFLNPMETLVTGYTRDGTFLIEDGSVTRPVVDMRIQQSMLEAFSNVELISGEQRLIPQYGAMMLVPFVKINGFNLSAA